MGYKEEVYNGNSWADILDDLTETQVAASSTLTSNGRSAQEIMRSYILEASKANQVSPRVYRDVLRSVIASFGNLYYLDGDGKTKRVLSDHANAERTIGKKFKENTIVLPFITIGQTGSESDSNKQRYDNILIQSRVWDEDKQRAERVIKLADVPVKVTYAINVWTKYMADMDQLTESIRLKFNPGVALKTGFSDSVKCFLTSEDDTSTLNVADKEERLIRKKFIAQAEFFIPSPSFKVTSTGRIEKVVNEIWVS